MVALVTRRLCSSPCGRDHGPVAAMVRASLPVGLSHLCGRQGISALINMSTEGSCPRGALVPRPQRPAASRASKGVTWAGHLMSGRRLGAFPAFLRCCRQPRGPVSPPQWPLARVCAKQPGSVPSSVKPGPAVVCADVSRVWSHLSSASGRHAALHTDPCVTVCSCGRELHVFLFRLLVSV